MLRLLSEPRPKRFTAAAFVFVVIAAGFSNAHSSGPTLRSRRTAASKLGVRGQAPTRAKRKVTTVERRRRRTAKSHLHVIASRARLAQKPEKRKLVRPVNMGRALAALAWRTGISVECGRALISIAQAEKLTIAFRPIEWWKRPQAMIAAILGVAPKPQHIKSKVGVVGWILGRDIHGALRSYRSDYDPVFYMRNDRMLSNAEALQINEQINAALGRTEIQHGTLLTANEVLSSLDVANIMAPASAVVISVDDSTAVLRTLSAEQLADDPRLSWHW